LQTAGQKNTTTANAAIIMILEPVWTVILSMVWYNEILGLTQVIGCGFILFSLLIYRGSDKIYSFIKS